MNIVDLLQITKGGRALLEQGDALGLSKGDMVGALGRLVPALAGAMQHQSQAQGLELSGLLGQLDASGLADAVDAEETASLESFRRQGENVLTRLLGSQENANTLASRIASGMGLEASALQALSPLVAGLFAGVLGRVEDGSFAPSGGGMAVKMAANMLMSSGSGAKGLLGFIDTDSASGLLEGLLG